MIKRFFPFAVCFLISAPLRAAQYGRDVVQMMALQASAGANQAELAGELPVRILEQQLENEIRAGNHAVTLADLEKCKFVYPNGSFAWGKPTVGAVSPDKPTCVAEVYIKNGDGVQSDKAVALAYVPAGSSIKCNISEFPEAGYQPAAEQVMFPADREPTVEEVEEAMNKEQKQNAGIKSLTAALIGGAGMFIASGDAGMGKKVAATAAGAAGAGGLAYASTQTGKVMGDTIMSAGMNAAAGAVVGNMGAGMASGGDSILMVKDCLNDEGKPDGRKCLWGYVRTDGTSVLTYSDSSSGSRTCYYKNDGTVVCQVKEENVKYEPVFNTSNIKFNNTPDDVSSMTDKTWADYFNTNKNESGNIGCFEREENYYKHNDINGCTVENFFVKIKSGMVNAKSKLAMIEDFGKDGFFGTTMREYNANKPDGKIVVGRKTDGTRNHVENEEYTVANFVPLTVGADDGDTVDFQNKARLKGTMIGAGAGAAVGALASFQGAKAEVQERYLVELEKYEGSLKNFYCITGSRYLGKYNEEILIDPMK
ncbi:MAG: hypothetical protein LBT45_03630 [Rickettsiales bacterium]|jgi:hypothetical protein|nr:hypothetical protein [Rickettsiales bacterium]